MKRAWQPLYTFFLVTAMVVAVGCGEETQDQGNQGTENNNSGENNANNTNNTNNTNNANNANNTNNIPDPDPEEGASDFVSADGQNGQDSRDEESGNNSAPDANADDGAGGEERTVEEGDIYRVLGDERILNLNSFRGVQVINVSDVSAPRVEGRAAMAGYPVEMYVAGDKAIVLLNDWRGYYRSIYDTRPEQYSGGVVITVDISDPANPQVIDREQVPGWIQTSRLTRQGDQIALYAVASTYGWYVDEDGNEQNGSYTYVRSFQLEGSDLAPRSEINLGGYVGDIQATTEALLVSRVDWNWQEPRSTISVIDISDPAGTMVEGSAVTVEGYVANKYNMDLYNGVLRIVSGSSWGNGTTNHVQTFDATNIHDLAPLDHETFGDNENLFATLFLGNKAFFVTYLRTDPFHGFEIRDDGEIIEHTEFIISGWNNFLRPVFNKERLIGIGFNDEDGSNTLAVSLYNTDLADPTPFIARKEVQSEWGWSEAAWDDRAFSVLEGAVEVVAEDGTPETGLVLLPFSGYDQDTQQYIAAVQIFTFSDSTLTQRGLMTQGSFVRRSFQADADLTANLSEVELSLFDTQNPDEPRELGRVELAPNYTDFLIYGDFGVRVNNKQDWYAWWGNQNIERPGDLLDIIPVDGDPDSAAAVASIPVPANAQVFKVEDLLVSMRTRYVQDDPNTGDYHYETDVAVWDLSTPARPSQTSAFTTRDIQPYYPYYGRGWDDCFDCGWGWGWGYNSLTAVQAGQALVFPQATQEQERLGIQHVCSYNVRESRDCWDHQGPTECTYYSGYRTCTSLNGGETACQGEFYLCHQDAQGATECEEIPFEQVPTQEYCYDQELYRYWQTFNFRVLDLSNPARPDTSTQIQMDSDQEGVNFLSDGDDLYVSFKRPADVEGDGRPYVRYYFQKFDLSTPSAPVAANPINIPGELFEVDGDNIFTRDYVWGDTIVETAINKLHVRDGRAFLDARRRFTDEYVQSITLDGRGNLLVSHQTAWQVWSQEGNNEQPQTQQLTILDASDELQILSETEVDLWAWLRDVKDGRALFQVPGGLLVLNVDDASAPFAQAYFPTLAWPVNILLHEDSIFFAGGRYGMYRFDLDEENLFVR